MRRVRLSKWSEQLLQASSSPARAPLIQSTSTTTALITRRYQSSVASTAEASAPPTADTSAPSANEPVRQKRRPIPSPPHSRAASSAKLAALHARLSLSNKVPLETLARALINPTADQNANFNNSNLSFLGSTIINLHVLEYLMCKWPRLPMAILFEALRAFAGKESLHAVARRWGVESAAVPGAEVDPGLLQWSAEGNSYTSKRWGYLRSKGEQEQGYRIGMSSRVVMDDPFGDTIHQGNKSNRTVQELHDVAQDNAYESFVHAVVGAVQLHCGREAAKTFVTSHVLSRQLDPSKLFAFNNPTRELAMLCAREGFESPIARLESETGRRSRTPVFVVGIYSGKEKLGEGAGASLDTARKVASMNALKAWYLYSPGNKVRVPSDMLSEGARPWTAPHIDPGEITI